LGKKQGISCSHWAAQILQTEKAKMKKENIMIKVNGLDKDRWKKVAALNGKTLSGAIRDAMSDYELAGGPRPKKITFK